MKELQTLAIIGWCIALAAPALADDAVTPQSPPVVQQFAPVLVEGMGNPATISYANLLRGVQAFNDNRPMAPTANLRFRATDLASSSTPLTLRLETEDKVIPIEVDGEGFFLLPDPDTVGATNGELVANRHAGTVHIGPVVRSAGFDEKRFRLGDERLWCEVVFAIGRDEISLPTRLKVALSGPICKNDRIKVFHIQRLGNVVSGKLMEAKSEMDVIVKNNGFSVPLHDKAWSHDAIVELQMADTISTPTENSR